MSIVDADDGWRPPQREVDVCILGAGAAGITLAMELAGTGRECLVLEGGGARFSRRSQDLYRGSVTGLPYPQTDDSRLRYLGGTTNHWNGFCRRLDPLDLESRPQSSKSGWPISYDELTRYYPRAEELCELGTGDWDAKRWLGEMNAAPLPLAPDRFTTEVFRFSPPTRFGSRYLEVLESADATIASHANAVALRTDRESRVRAVRVATNAGDDFTVRARNVVLAMGGMENARFLLNVAGDLPVLDGNEWLGACFMDHLHLYDAATMVSSASVLGEFAGYLARFTDEAGSCLPILVTSAPWRSAQGLSGFSVEFNDEGDLDRDAAPRSALLATRGVRSLMRFGNSGADHLVTFTIRAEQLPSRRSRVSLSDRTDRYGLRRPTVDWQIDDLDRESVVRSADLLAREFARLGLGRVHHELRRDEAWSGLRGGNHHMGTTRMSTSLAQGVVDGDCRIHGTANLYAAGSSVFPTSGCANPTLTIVALALRLAQHLSDAE